MKRFSQTLLAEMEEQLHHIHATHEDPIKFSAEAIKFLIPLMERLKSFSVKYKFVDKEEEIAFFRDIKPQFASTLMYYNEVYTIEIGKPIGGEKVFSKYYKSELAKLKSFFDDNAEFYRYYRSGSNEFDGKYFLRGKLDLMLSFDSIYFQADKRFTTARDYKVSRIMANEKLLVYLEAVSQGNPGKIPTPVKKANWTAPKVALVELIYALHAMGVLNNGTSDLRELATFFESAFNVDLGQYHKTFLEIRERKSDRARFLTTLREKFMLRMEEADDN